jgi:hypothetical protein
MIGWLTRPARRRPRTVPLRARATLRLESLEARANPAAPVLSGVAAKWVDTNVVYIAGTVQDENPATAVVHLGGGVQQDIRPDASGNFSIFAKSDGTSTVYVRATDDEGLASGTAAVQFGQAVTKTGSDQTRITLATGEPVLNDVTISRDDNGVWHIRGHVDGTSPIGTVIKIINAPDGTQAESGAVNDDGSFDIVINVGGSGAISIIAVDGNGNQSDAWDGTIF